MIVEDGAGGGHSAKVNDRNQLFTLSESRSIQYNLSREDGQAYQAPIIYSSVSNTTNNLILLKNLSPNRNMVITYFRVQALDLAGGTALPSANTYFSIFKNPTYQSGGDSLSPINMNFGSANIADIIGYQNGFLTSDNGDEIDRIFLPSDGHMETFNKEGSIILAQNDSLMISLITDHTSGVAYSRISFLMPEV